MLEQEFVGLGVRTCLGCPASGPELLFTLLGITQGSSCVQPNPNIPGKGGCSGNIQVHVIKTPWPICIRAEGFSHTDVRSTREKKRKVPAAELHWFPPVTRPILEKIRYLWPTSCVWEFKNADRKRQLGEVRCTMINPSASSLLILCGMVLLLVYWGGRGVWHSVCIAGRPGSHCWDSTATRLFPNNACWGLG